MAGVVVFGASGVIGKAAVRQFVAAGHDVLGVSRRDPHVPGAAHLPLDLHDGDACRTALAAVDVQHVVYAAMVEAPGLVGGWRDEQLMAQNLQMLRNAVDPLLDRPGMVRHVSLLQGIKAYGVHLDRVPVPVRERSPRHDHANFYFLHEDHLRDRQRRSGSWGLTILRPQVVYGDSLGSPMNLIPAIGAFAAISRDQGRPLCFPGGAPHFSEAVDADLLGRVLVWATDAPGAQDRTFNVTNGDAFVWHYVWPAIADALGMEVGAPAPLQLAVEMPKEDARWAAIVERHGLVAPPSLAAFVGDSFTYADLLFGYGNDAPGLPVLASTIALRQAGFAACCDTEDMFRRWFRRLQDERLLPKP